MLVVEILSAVMALIFFKKYKDQSTRWILLNLWFVVIVELCAMQLRKYNLANQWLYNILGVLEIVVFQYIFYRESTSSIAKRIIKCSAIVSIIAVIVEGLIYSKQPFLSFLNYSFAISSFLIAVSALLYLRQVVRTEKILYLKSVLLFWISIGLLFYHICNLPITVLSNVLLDLDVDTYGLLLIQAFAGILMYVCFILGFIWSKKKYNS